MLRLWFSTVRGRSSSIIAISGVLCPALIRYMIPDSRGVSRGGAGVRLPFLGLSWTRWGWAAAGRCSIATFHMDAEVRSDTNRVDGCRRISGPPMRYRRAQLRHVGEIHADDLVQKLDVPGREQVQLMHHPPSDDPHGHRTGALPELIAGDSAGLVDV